MPQASSESNIGRTLGFLRRRGIWIALCVILASVAAFGLSKHQPKKYTATASLVFNENQLTQEIAGFSASSTNLLIQQESNLELLHLGSMAVETAAVLGHGLTEEKVSQSVSIVGQTESSVAGVAVTMRSPTLAAQVANTYAKQFVNEQQTTNRRYFRAALALVHKQLAALSTRQRNGTAGVTLQDRAQSLTLLAELQPNTVEIAQLASVPKQPSSPKTSRNTLIGALLGLFVGIGVALLLDRIDPRTKDAGELEAIYRAPLLGVVPRSARLSTSSRGGSAATQLDLPATEAEAFHLIRARLRTFNADRKIRTLLVSSAGPGEGKTTVALQLASAAARMGSRVLLIEANLRNPAIAKKLGISPRVGLSEVLSRTNSMEEAIQAVEPEGVTVAGAHGVGRLDLLPSGPSIPPSPVELVASDTMDEVLARARAAYDLVVIDAPDLDAVSDGFLLLSRVDGVVIVGRAGRSRRDSGERISQLLRASGAPLVGVILNGGKAKNLHKVAYGSNYVEADEPPSSRAPSSGTSADGEFVPTANV